MSYTIVAVIVELLSKAGTIVMKRIPLGLNLAGIVSEAILLLFAVADAMTRPNVAITILPIFVYVTVPDLALQGPLQECETAASSYPVSNVGVPPAVGKSNPVVNVCVAKVGLEVLVSNVPVVVGRVNVAAPFVIEDITGGDENVFTPPIV